MALLALALLAGAWFSVRYAWWRRPVDYRFPRILMYHMIDTHRRGARFNGLRVTPSAFEAQLRWLREHGWQSVTVSELLDSSRPVAEKSFAITFDDGYENNLTEALPLLRKYGCKATLYLVVDRLDRDWSVQRKAHHNEGELRREPKLSDAQVRELLDSGHFELGSHTMTHANFAHLGDTAIARELQDSRRVLRQRFGVSVNSFAYPFGIYRPELGELVRQAGYQSAVTTREGIDDPAQRKPMELRRIKVSGKDSLFAFKLRMRGGRRGW